MAVELAVGIGLTGVLAAVRFFLLPLTGEVAPYALVFTAVVGAAVLAGWRSSLIALVLGQLLMWIFVLEPRGGLTGKDGAQVAGLVVATVAQVIVLVTIALYQREVASASSRLESERDLLERALAEIDHRTVNNYQAVLSLILAQTQGTPAGESAKAALQKISDRIRAIANASRRLAASRESLEAVRIDEHLRELCTQIETGLSRRGVRVECDLAEVQLDPSKTTAISLLVNELVTNALKHAFPDDRTGLIRVILQPAPNAIELIVEDNGVGIEDVKRSQSTGLGTRLVATFVKQMRAKHSVTSGQNGTRHKVRIPD